MDVSYLGYKLACDWLREQEMDASYQGCKLACDWIREQEMLVTSQQLTCKLLSFGRNGCALPWL